MTGDIAKWLVGADDAVRPVFYNHTWRVMLRRGGVVLRPRPGRLM